MAVEFHDYSINVKAELNDITKGWLYEASNEIASHAKDNCATTDDNGDLKKSYRAVVNLGAGEAQIGSPLESALWEEFGTGEHAVKEPHRSDWWVYIEGGSGYEGETNHYKTQADAEAAAASIRKKYGKKAVATDGRDPNYTLEKAFTVKGPKVVADLEKKLKAGLG